MKYITIIITILLIAYFIYPRPEKAQGEYDIYKVKIIRDYNRSIKDEIKHVFGDNWKIAYAVMMSESRGKATAKNINSSGSIDFGFWQINNYYHPEISYECAIDIECSTEYAYNISNKGTNWNAWYGYKNGGYLTFMK